MTLLNYPQRNSISTVQYSYLIMFTKCISFRKIYKSLICLSQKTLLIGNPVYLKNLLKC